MDELIRLLWAYLQSDDGPELYNGEGEHLSEAEALEVAQQLAGAIAAAGWPRSDQKAVQA